MYNSLWWKPLLCDVVNKFIETTEKQAMAKNETKIHYDNCPKIESAPPRHQNRHHMFEMVKNISYCLWKEDDGREKERSKKWVFSADLQNAAFENVNPNKHAFSMENQKTMKGVIVISQLKVRN